MFNNLKSFTILLSTLFLFACGGGSSSIASPGEAGPFLIQLEQVVQVAHQVQS